MRLDHVAYRVKDRLKTAQFFIDAFGYRKQQEFELDFGGGKTASCIALEPPEKLTKNLPWVAQVPITWVEPHLPQQYHLPPEIFVSDGNEGSIVGEWVRARDDIGGIHHMAYQVKSVEAIIKEWKDKGYAEFSSDAIKCPGLVQVFTKPSELTGVIYEFIERAEYGFCKENVKRLMLSTTENKN